MTADISNFYGNLSKQLNSLNISITNKNVSTLDQINNLTTYVKDFNASISHQANTILTDVINSNASIIDQLLIENTTVNNVNSIVGKIKSDIYVIENNIMSDINSSSLNVTTRETTIKSLISLSLQEENSTFSYQLKFGTPSVSGNNYSFPVFVMLFNGQMANLSITQQAWQDLKLYYVSGNSTYPLNFGVKSVQPGSFVMTIYNVTPAMAEGITSNQALITAQGQVKEGVLTNLAAGIIGSQQIQYASSNIWTEIFGISPPKENNSAVGILSYLSWLQESYAGRALYLLVVFAILGYYVIAIDLKMKEKRSHSTKQEAKDGSKHQ
jgi:hypothetical protein